MDVERTPVTLRQYLQESGTGSFKKYRVPDLLPERGHEVEVLLVVESPHIDELRTGLPLSGDAGRRALTFLLPSGRLPEALGPYLAGLHTTNNPRMGILNVCPVPLQSGAFARHRMPPDLPQSDWDLLEDVRSHRASAIARVPSSAAMDANTMLLPGLESRLAAITLSPNAMVFIAGNFVHRTWESLASPTKLVVLQIPHPSNGWWTRTKRQQYIDNLGTLKARFASLTP